MSAKSVTERHYPCASCGADLRFAPAVDQLVCDHCGHIAQIPNALGQGQHNLRELPLEEGLSAALPASEMREARATSCPNCGARFEMQGAQHAAQCPFCATPVVTDTGVLRAIKPQGLVPFRLTEAQAHKALGDWLGSLWFAPSSLTAYARRGRKMTGVYAPFWTFDAQTRASYQGARGDYYTDYERQTVMVDGRHETRDVAVQRIRWTPVSGRVSRAFDDVLIYAARSLPERDTHALQPWDLADLQPYTPDYLAGFEAEGYTLDLREGHYRAQAEMMRVIESDVRRDIGGAQQQVARIDPEFARETFKHILLPVWTAAYKYRERSYRFVVNAQTGRVQGERPYSAWKIAFAVLLAALLIGAGLYYGDRAGYIDVLPASGAQLY